MRFENTEVFNFKGAFRGMRNAHESWDKSDSWFGTVCLDTDDGSELDVVDAWIDNENHLRRAKGIEELTPEMEDYYKYYDTLEKYSDWLVKEGQLSYSNNYYDYYDMAFLGPADLGLAQKLILAGDEHGKFTRQIFVSVDIEAPLEWWKQMDTYQIATTKNSSSTMHKLTSREIVIEDFAMKPDDSLIVTSGSLPHGGEWEITFTDYATDIVDMCENLRQKYLETKDRRYWRALIDILPESYIQKRTWTGNYQVLRTAYFQRKGHKLHEWEEFCEWVRNLPYGRELITIGE